MKVKSVFTGIATPFFCLTVNALVMSSLLPVATNVYAQDVANSFPMYRYNLQRTGSGAICRAFH